MGVHQGAPDAQHEEHANHPYVNFPSIPLAAHHAPLLISWDLLSSVVPATNGSALLFECCTDLSKMLCRRVDVRIRRVAVRSDHYAGRAHNYAAEPTSKVCGLCVLPLRYKARNFNPEASGAGSRGRRTELVWRVLEVFYPGDFRGAVGRAPGRPSEVED